MESFRQFSLLPTELRVQIWELAVEADSRIISIEYDETVDEYFPDPNTPPPNLMHACNESRMVASKHYVKAFKTSNSDRYHWVCFPTDHFLIDGPDLQLIERPETALMQHLRVEVGPGNADDVEGWWASHEMPPLAERYPNVKQLLLLVDKPLINWITMLIMWSNPSDVYVIQVHSGEYLHPANCTDYYDWYCTQNGLEQQRASVQFHGPDGDVQRYTSDVCPAEQLDGWEFPPEPSLNWGEYECASEEEEEDSGSGSEGGDSETEGEDSE